MRATPQMGVFHQPVKNKKAMGSILSSPHGFFDFFLFLKLFKFS